MDVRVIYGVHRTIQAGGEIDLSNAGELNEALHDAVLESLHGFVIDLTDVTYMDSAGLQAILAAYRKVQTSGGRLAIVAVHPNITEILHIISADKLPGLFICQNRCKAEEALAGTGGGRE